MRTNEKNRWTRCNRLFKQKQLIIDRRLFSSFCEDRERERERERMSSIRIVIVAFLWDSKMCSVPVKFADDLFSSVRS